MHMCVCRNQVDPKNHPEGSIFFVLIAPSGPHVFELAVLQRGGYPLWLPVPRKSWRRRRTDILRRWIRAQVILIPPEKERERERERGVLNEKKWFCAGAEHLELFFFHFAVVRWSPGLQERRRTLHRRSSKVPRSKRADAATLRPWLEYFFSQQTWCHAGGRTVKGKEATGSHVHRLWSAISIHSCIWIHAQCHCNYAWMHACMQLHVFVRPILELAVHLGAQLPVIPTWS